MALTPEDVVNKRFQPTKFREGYDQDEVDDFLDEIVVELRRLNQENEELRQRLIAGESRISELQRSAAQPQTAVEHGQLADEAIPRFGETPIAAPAAVVPAPIAYPSPDQDAIDSGSTNNLLQLARKLHEEHVREGIEKRDALIAEGHATAARVVSEAEAAVRSQNSQLDSERAGLEHQIESLRTFEREYRQKLKGYIEAQLTELDATESAPVPQYPASVSSSSVSSAPGSSTSVSSAGSSPAGSATQYGAVPASSGQYDLGSSDGTQSPRPASFQGLGGN